LQKSGLNLPDRAVAAFYLVGLPKPQYTEFIRSICRTEKGKITSKYVKSQLIVEERRMGGTGSENHKVLKMKNTSDKQERVEKNFSSNPHHAKPERTTGTQDAGNSRPGRRQQYVPVQERCVICYCCGKKGHRAYECPLSSRNKQQKPAEMKEERKTAAIVSRGF